MQPIRLIFFVVFIAASTLANAENFYAEGDVLYNTFKVEDQKFKLFSGKIKLGYYAMKQVAIELQYAGLGEDENNGSKLELDHILGGYLRLESQLRSRVRMYVLAGYAQTAFTVKGQLEEFKADDFSNFSWGIGAEDQMTSLGRNTYLTLDYMRYYKNDGVEISGFSIGLRFLF